MASFKKLVKGDKLSETTFYTVDKIYGSEVDLKDSMGTVITVNDNYVDKMLISASQFEKEEKIGKIAAADLLKANPNMAITVNFNKKIEDKDQNDGIKAILGIIKGETTVPNPVEFAKATLQTITEGEERTMVGRHNNSYTELGRLNFIDMKAGEGHNYRQIDPRTINWMVINNVKYNVK